MEIKPIRIPQSVIRQIPPPVVDRMEPPVVSAIEVPVLDVPNPVIEYPTLDVPTRELFEGQVGGQQQEEKEEQTDPDRQMPPPPPTPAAPTIQVGGVDVTLPAPDVIATAGATAVVATSASIVGGIVVRKSLEKVGDLVKKKKFKVKIKTVKPVLHYVMTDTGSVDIFEYSKKGTKIVDSTDKVETYLRDQIDIDSSYELFNVIVIDDNLKDQFTKEGQKRFKSLFVPPAKIAKKLAAKFSF